MALQYEQVDDLPEETLVEILGPRAEGKTEAQMRAIVKGALRADEETINEPEMDAIAETSHEVVATEEVKDPDRDRVIMGSVEDAKDSNPDTTAEETITISKVDFEKVIADIAEIRRENREMKSSITSRNKMTRRVKQEMAHERCRVSDTFRDILAEYRLYKQQGITKQIIVKRTFQVESEAFKNGRYAPCAANGGLYYIRNKNWNASPRTGEIRTPFVFNRHLYVDYTIKGNQNELLRDDMALVDYKGNDVKPFVNHLPIENLDVIREQARLAEKQRMEGSGIVEALKKLSGG